MISISHEFNFIHSPHNQLFDAYVTITKSLHLMTLETSQTLEFICILKFNRTNEISLVRMIMIYMGTLDHTEILSLITL